MGKNGAPVGNKNALKHGFYSKAVTSAEKLQMEKAKGIQGMDDELALLRAKLYHLLENYPDRTDLHMNAVSMIASLCQTRYATTPLGREELKAAISNVLMEVAIHLGLK